LLNVVYLKIPEPTISFHHYAPTTSFHHYETTIFSTRHRGVNISLHRLDGGTVATMYSSQGLHTTRARRLIRRKIEGIVGHSSFKVLREEDGMTLVFDRTTAFFSATERPSDGRDAIDGEFSRYGYFSH
jgi:hypothetical protein